MGLSGGERERSWNGGRERLRDGLRDGERVWVGGGCRGKRERELGKRKRENGEKEKEAGAHAVCPGCKLGLGAVRAWSGPCQPLHAAVVSKALR